MEELIVVKQLPIIEENLKRISDEIEKKVNIAESLVCTEDTVKEVKKVRTEIGKQFKELESQRKQVKEKVMKPYDDFEKIYKEYISEKFKNADSILKTKIDSVENELKESKNKEILDYFLEYANSKKIDWIDVTYYLMAEINVTLSASIKSLKEQATNFIDKVSDDINLINTQDNSDEILIEYKKDLNVSRAIAEVKNRHIELEKAKEEKENKKEQELTDEAMLEKIDNLTAPKVEEKEQVFEMTFKVKGTMEQLKEIKEFLENGGFDYE